MKTKTKLLALLLVAAMPMFLSCGQHDPYEGDGINWDGSNSGTLELINGSNKDMILFVGQTPAPSNMLGGVRAGATIKHDISGLVSDFNIGGYAILRGVSKDEYEKHSDDPSKAKIEFTAMVTYKTGTTYRYNIDRSFTGENAFKATNRGRIGIELRKDSPDGEKVAYLPALSVSQMIYTETTTPVTLFPVYVFFNKTTGEVSTLKSTTMFDAVMASPRPLSPPNNENVNTYFFPNDQTLTWDYIKGTLKQSAAYVTVVHSVTNQSAYVTIGLSKTLYSQNGYASISAGEKLTYEIESTDEGAGIGLIINFYNGSILVPVLVDGEIPILKNGYDYTVSVSYTGGASGNIQNVENYKATIVESKNPRDLSDQIESL